jgi:predicted glycoside hydrolase/deacetylase ChbG (UPF0249 family)
MIIINADDWGRSKRETDVALSCYKKGRITSATAMVFMEDSARSAELAKAEGIDVGLHLNFSQIFTGEVRSGILTEYHNSIVRFLTINKYCSFIYNPFLRRQFRYLYEAQVEEFLRLYGRPPSHVDGHHHMHLCSNMLFGGIISKGTKVRRNFSFFPAEKNILNRAYRSLVDLWLARRYTVTNYFIALSQYLQPDRMVRVAELARVGTVEIMTHPANPKENTCLMSNEFLVMVRELEKGTYASLAPVFCRKRV